MSHLSGWQLIRLLQVFESIATHWVFTTVSWQIFCGCFCWALAPFAVCFAVLLMVRRKSGWGICVLPCVFGGLCFGFMICQAACDHLCPCRSFLNNSFFSCKDRALERDRPYQRKKGASGVHIGCCLNPLEVSFLLFRCVWWLDYLPLKEGPSAFYSP